MDKFLVVFKREYMERVRSRWFLIATLLGPLFFGVITILPAVLASKTKSSTDITNIAILDATGTDLGQRVSVSLSRIMPTGPKAEVRAVDAARLAAAESLATKQVMSKDKKGYLVLDDSTLAGQRVRYAGRNASTLVDVEQLRGAVRQSLLSQRFEKEGISAERVMTLTAMKMESKAEKISDRGREGAGGLSNIIFGYMIAFLLYMMITLYGQNILRGVMEEKTTRVAEVVVSSVKTDTLLAGKIFGVGSVALTQVLVWAAIGGTLYFKRAQLLAKFGVQDAGAVSFPSVPVGVAIALLLLFLFGFIFYAALFAAVGSMVNNQEDAQQAAMPVMLLLITSIIFMQPVLLNPSSSLARVTSWLPFSAPILMPIRMSLTSIPWTEIVATIAGVAIACGAAIWVSARIYRVGLLMYGKRPTFGELVRWIRAA